MVTSKWLLFSLKDLLGRLCNKRGTAVFLPNVLFMIFAGVTGRMYQRKAGWLDILHWRNFQSSGDVGVTGGGVGGFKGGILAADRCWVLVLVVFPAVINNKG